ncbi:MAG: hypothetical protein ABSF99_08495, partial [Anaerolineales bacterium]
EPGRPETRERLNLPQICLTCGRKVKSERHVPAWLSEAVDNLQRLEASANIARRASRVYGRGGKRVAVSSSGKEQC